nr:MAG TPA: hypothetical protein [Caudoviricetes sp.]
MQWTRVVKWISVAVAVSVGIYITKSAWCLWAFILPICGD